MNMYHIIICFTERVEALKNNIKYQVLHKSQRKQQEKGDNPKHNRKKGGSMEFVKQKPKQNRIFMRQISRILNERYRETHTT